ncbi:hypothetical protein GCM10023080_068780 [Streptomyces pseudoechinosporeus]
MRRSLSFLASALLVLALGAPATAADGDDGSEGFTIKDPRITESSGLVASRAHPGIYWTHNDQDKGAFLYAIDSKTGDTVATITMTGVGTPRDVEAISIGPDGDLYVGDIGDNLGGTWEYVWIYKLPEPGQLRDQSVRATQYVVKYADGARDAEALMVHPKTGKVYIASKNEQGGGLYEQPATLSPSGTNVFKRIADIDLEVTDGAFAPDGEQLALRAYFGGVAYEWNGGKPKRQGRLSVPLQRQGESVAYTPDGSTLLFGSEGTESSVEPGNVPGAEDSKSPSEDGSSAADGDSAGDGSNGDFKMAAIALAAGLAVLYGLKRLLRRGS